MAADADPPVMQREGRPLWLGTGYPPPEFGRIYPSIKKVMEEKGVNSRERERESRNRTKPVLFVSILQKFFFTAGIK
jgi:hypothetical protein